MIEGYDKLSQRDKNMVDAFIITHRLQGKVSRIWQGKYSLMVKWQQEGKCYSEWLENWACRDEAESWVDKILYQDFEK